MKIETRFKRVLAKLERKKKEGERGELPQEHTIFLVSPFGPRESSGPSGTVPGSGPRKLVQPEHEARARPRCIQKSLIFQFITLQK